MSMLNRIGAHKFMARTDSAPVLTAPAVLAIKGASGRSGAIDAGRLMSRAWIELNRQGVAVHPYYVITDQIERFRANTLPSSLREQVGDIAADCAALCGLQESEKLYMLFRTGYPTRTAPKSMRLPLEAVFSDESAASPAP
jgi:hypothetical protein